MKKTILACCFLGCLLSARADHITGGEMYYTFEGVVNGNNKYHVVVKFFMLCSSSRMFNDPTIVSVFDRATNLRIKDITVSLAGSEELALTNTNRCITDPPPVCYRVGRYEFSMELPPSEDGYVLSCQVVFRIQGISNLITNYGNIGATYTAEIPGTINSTQEAQNNSAKFSASDLVIVCANNSFSYSFKAVDPDGDELRYSFCNAYVGGAGFANSAIPPTPPPYGSVPYNQSAAGTAPLGQHVKIDPFSGLIRGLAPESGIYVVTVCVEEIRNGKVIARQRKDLQITITSCTIAAASLPDSLILCGESFNVGVSNMSNSPLINSTKWNVMDRDGNVLFTSAARSLNYKFPDTGVYKIDLLINQGQQCSDSTQATAIVYPGFEPDFEVQGLCVNKNTQFFDASESRYGSLASWQWDFGDNLNLFDVSDKRDPEYIYRQTGGHRVHMVVSDTKGCIDTVVKSLTILEKANLQLAFKDTLICKNDVLQLNAKGRGIFNWTGTAMTNGNSPTPTVAPQSTSMYYVALDDQGCTNTDSVRVNVVDKVTLLAMPDTTVCATDVVELRVSSNALRYEWVPSVNMNNSRAANPTVQIDNTTSFTLTGTIGGCSATDEVKVTAVPYPIADAGADTMICYQTFAELDGTMNGNRFLWTPSPGSHGGSSLDPIVRPEETTVYTLSVFADAGCPKPGTDQVQVTVLPPISPYAGRDTTVVVGQPLRLMATGGTQYNWFPPDNLSAANVADPIALFTEAHAGKRYTVSVGNAAGCSETASITIKVFNTTASVFVPNAFTPNNDGLNDRFNVILAGIAKLERFAVFNRWGQKVYEGLHPETGWDGSIAGKPQPAGLYVYSLRALDYSGRVIEKKGTVLLVR
jgi:gliding motility-associated-like protein